MAPREPESTDWQVNYPEIKMRSAHLLRSGEWADCSFQFESGAGEAAPSLAAHRLILAMASPVFAAMFYGRVGDKEEPIHISDIDHDVFSSMLDYIYTDEVEITGLEMASELFRAANKYILVHLERKCINYLLKTLSPQKACYIYELSCMYNEEELKTKCVEEEARSSKTRDDEVVQKYEELVRDEVATWDVDAPIEEEWGKFFRTNTLDVIKANTFKDAQFETLKTIYSLDSLSIDSELDLFEALVEYTKYNKEIQSLEDNTMQANGESQQVKNETDTNNESTDAGHLIKKDEKKHMPPGRKIIPGLVEKVRFLTLTVLELTECKNLASLLTESEILALMFKISSPRYSHKIPEGFSKSTISRSMVDKHRLSASILVKIENISTIRNEDFNIFGKTATLLHRSNIFYVMNVPWQFFVWRRNINIHMHYNKDGDKKDKVFEKSEETFELFVGLQCLINGDQNNNNNLDESKGAARTEAFCEVEILPTDNNDESCNDEIELVQSKDLLFKRFVIFCSSFLVSKKHQDLDKSISCVYARAKRLCLAK
ncbi:BTB/POZ domain-containing protein [Phthorimaea operculella]|nr:BTB/POZ domain-containing protein [Phthorimaea operculella]